MSDEPFKQSDKAKEQEKKRRRGRLVQKEDGRIVWEPDSTPEELWKESVDHEWEPPVPDPNQPKSPGVV